MENSSHAPPPHHLGATVGFSLTEYSISEGDAVTLSVVLSAETGTEVPVEFVTIAGTATSKLSKNSVQIHII